MGIASLIFGILSVLFAIIPGCGLFLAPFPALIGLGLGIADWVSRAKRAQPKGIAVAGTAVSLLAFVVLGAWVAVLLAQKPEGMTYWEWFDSQKAGVEEAQQEFQRALEEMQEAAREASEAPPGGGTEEP